MATSGSKAAAGDLLVDSLISSCGNVSNFVKPTGVYFNDRRLHKCQKVGIRLKNQETVCRNNIYARCTFHITQSSGNSFFEPWFKGLHTSSSSCYSDGIVPDVSLGGLAFDQQLASSAIPTDQYVFLVLFSLSLIIFFNYAFLRDIT